MNRGESAMREAWQRLVDVIDYAATSVRLRVLDRIAGPVPETEVDRIREAEKERLQRTFPAVDIDGTGARRGAWRWWRNPRMISDLDIYRAANLLIERHGPDALIEAARRIDTMLDRGDVDGRLVWLRIKRAIVALQTLPMGLPN
jgi:hypothetical protein